MLAELTERLAGWLVALRAKLRARSRCAVLQPAPLCSSGDLCGELSWTRQLVQGRAQGRAVDERITAAEGAITEPATSRGEGVCLPETGPLSLLNADMPLRCAPS